MNGDLEGVLVVSIEQAVAAPYCAMRLADAGARVIKVERPEGDFARNYDTLAEGQSAYFVWLNRGKESLCLDLKNDADKALLRRIVKDADVLIQNLKPGIMAKLGLSMDALLADHPRLIGCSISGFGEEGPLSRLKAYDLIVQAETGLCSITGTPDSAARVGVSVCDIAAGMTAHAAILQALIARTHTGQDRQIEVSLFDSLADWLNSIEGLASHEHLRTVKVESGGVQLHVIAPGAQFSGARPANPTVPKHGAQTQAIRNEFGD